MMVMLGLGFGLGLGLMIALKVKWAKNNNTNQPKVLSLSLLMRRARLDNTHARSCSHAQTLHRLVFFSSPFLYLSNTALWRWSWKKKPAQDGLGCKPQALSRQSIHALHHHICQRLQGGVAGGGQPCGLQRGYGLLVQLMGVVLRLRQA